MPDKMNDAKEDLNRLIHEKSPYLLQHAHNPVDWYPWGEDAFKKAKEDNKLIFLSIGYSACHWCHVMAHESFENDSIAKIMNEHFVNIKVDREEHPDVDHLYQTFVQMTTGRGGWPLSVFLTADRVPFYGGTYFPAESRYGMISFPDLLQRVIDLYQNNPEKIRNSAQEIESVLQNMDNLQQAQSLPEATTVFDSLFAHLQNSFDSEFGGFGSAPKFPHVTDIDFLLNHYHYTGEAKAKEMALVTLRKMAQGGIYDQLGGGFHRYSTDEKWLVPHFEKMLYDNALLIPVYANAYRLTGDALHRRIALETADFVLRELRDKNGGFYSTLDADSEGEEGKYYVWGYEEINSILDEKVRDLFVDYYNLTPQGNFEENNILNVTASLEEVAQKHQISEKLARERLQKGQKRLMKARSNRERPGLDNKILADWNGMMISALWEAFQISEREEYQNAAKKAVEYIRGNFMDEDGRLYHFVKNDNDKIAGYIDDYAFVIQAMLDGFETTQQTDYLNLSIKLSDYVLEYFWDHKNGGFYFTDDKSDTTITRLRQNYDASTPAGGNVMTLNLLRLYHYSGDQKYQEKAEEVFKLYKQDIESRSPALTSLISALAYYHYSPLEITISTPESSDADEMMSRVHQMFVPNRVLLHINSPKIPESINPALVQDRYVPDKAAAFVCYQRTCSLPIYNPEDITQTVIDFGLSVR